MNRGKKKVFVRPPGMCPTCTLTRPGQARTLTISKEVEATTQGSTKTSHFTKKEICQAKNKQQIDFFQVSPKLRTFNAKGMFDKVSFYSKTHKSSTSNPSTLVPTQAFKTLLKRPRWNNSPRVKPPAYCPNIASAADFEVTTSPVSSSIEPNNGQAACVPSFVKETEKLTEENKGNSSFLVLNRFERHTKRIRFVFEADADTIVTCSDDTTLCVWGITKGYCQSTLEGHRGPINKCCFLNESKTALISCSEDATLRVWDWKNLNKKAEVLKGKKKHSINNVVALANNNILCSDDTGCLQLWQLSPYSLKGECTRIIRAHERSLVFLTPVECSVLFVTGSLDGNLKLWSSSNNNLEEKASYAHLRSIFCVEMLKSYVLSGSQDGAILVGEIKGYDLSLKWSLLHGEPVHVLRFWDDENLKIVSAGSSGNIKLFSFQEGTCLASIKAHSNWIMDLQVIKDKNYLLSSSLDNTVSLYSVSDEGFVLSSQTKTSTLVGFDSPVYRFLLVSSSSDTRTKDEILACLSNGSLVALQVEHSCRSSI